jgi:ABC-type glucose/galactose transport system permease subunit
MIMQVLAWMWVIVFTVVTGTWTWAGVNFIAHTLLLGAIVITVATFETAKRKPEYFGGFGRGNGGEHE